MDLLSTLRAAAKVFSKLDHRVETSSSQYLFKGPIDPLNLPKVPNQFFTKDSIQHTFPKISECFDSVIRFVGNGFEATGFIISSEGHILTNAHVAQSLQDKSLSHVLVGGNEPILAKEIIPIDLNFSTADLAMVKIPELAGRTPIKLSRQKADNGSRVFSIGNPGCDGIHCQVVSIGLLDHYDRAVETKGSSHIYMPYVPFFPYERFFRDNNEGPSLKPDTSTTDSNDQSSPIPTTPSSNSPSRLHERIRYKALIYDGCSGGPLLNDQGECIGINAVGSFSKENREKRTPALDAIGVSSEEILMAIEGKINLPL